MKRRTLLVAAFLYDKSMHKILLGLMAVFFAFPVFAKTVTLYHTSDTHGFFYPRDGRGGFGALAAVIKNGPKNYLLFDSGDFAEGTEETRRSKGLKTVLLMNKLGYHGATLGNHEFAYGDTAVANMISSAEFPFLAANFMQAGTGKYPPNVLPYKIFDADGIKVAVIGLANRYPSKSPKAYTLEKQLPILKKTLSAVEKKKPNVVIVLVHDSLQDDRPGSPHYMGDIGRHLGGRVHVALGGHAHAVFQNEYRGSVLFEECGSNLQSVGKITIETDDKTGKFLSARSELVPLVIAKTGEDADVKKYADSLREADVDEIIVRTSAALVKRSDNKHHMDFPVDNWVADAACRYAKADVCIHNTGGARIGLPKGNVTRRDLVELYPFDNDVMVGSVSGAFLKEMVRSGLTPWNRLAYSGLTLSYKKTKKGKIKNLKIWVHGEKLQDDKTYTVAVNSYMGAGRGEGKLFKTLPAGTMKKAGNKAMRQILEEDLKSGELLPPKTGRIIQQ